MRLIHLIVGSVLLAGLAFGDAERPVLFEVPAFVSAGTPVALATGDLDGNGLEDLVLASLSQEGLEVHLQGAELAFCSPAFVGSGSAYAEVALTDVDADGDLDLIACDASIPASLVVFLGDGSGAFREILTLPLGGQVSDMTLGDIDGNGFDDLAIALEDISRVQILLGTGTGAFAVLPTAFAPGGAQKLDLGDVSGDGILDLVVAGGPEGAVSYLRGLGLGAFGEAILRPALAPEAVKLGDIDGDGDLDLVVATFATKLGVFENIGGDFGEFKRFDVRVASRDLDLVDLDGDGNLDVILALADASSRFSVHALGVALGDGLGGFVMGPTYGGSLQGDGLDAIQCSDFDGDGAIDALVLGQGRGSVELYRGDGTGGFLDRIETIAPTSGRGALSIRAADFDEDGRDDIALHTGSVSQVFVHLSLGNGQLGFGKSVAGDGLVQALANPADMDGDGHLDLIFVDRVSGKEFFALALGDGTGSFGTIERASVPVNLERATVLDWNGDGALDVFGVGAEVNGVVGRYGDGAGGFIHAAGAKLLKGSMLSDMETGDFNGDSLVDLVVAAPSEGLLIALLSDGMGGILQRVDLALGSPLHTEVALGDLDQDGLLDIVSGGAGDDAVAIYWATAPGVFDSAVLLDGAPADRLEVGDLDGDGLLDIVALSAYRLTLHRSLGTGLFSAPQFHGGRGFQPAFALADIDGDGFLEVFTGDPTNKIAYYADRNP